MINKEKNQQIEINENAPNQRGIEEKNQLAGVKIGYNVFAFLFQVLVASGRPHFCFVVLVSKTTKSQAIERVVLEGREIVVGLLGLSL